MNQKARAHRILIVGEAQEPPSKATMAVVGEAALAEVPLRNPQLVAMTRVLGGTAILVENHEHLAMQSAQRTFHGTVVFVKQYHQALVTEFARGVQQLPRSSEVSKCGFRLHVDRDLDHNNTIPCTRLQKQPLYEEFMPCIASSFHFEAHGFGLKPFLGNQRSAIASVLQQEAPVAMCLDESGRLQSEAMAEHFAGFVKLI